MQVDKNLIYGLLEFLNDKWITVHPHGEDSKGTPLLVKDGESAKEAIDRKFGENKAVRPIEPSQPVNPDKPRQQPSYDPKKHDGEDGDFEKKLKEAEEKYKSKSGKEKDTFSKYIGYRIGIDNIDKAIVDYHRGHYIVDGNKLDRRNREAIFRDRSLEKYDKYTSRGELWRKIAQEDSYFAIKKPDNQMMTRVLKAIKDRSK